MEIKAAPHRATLLFFVMCIAVLGYGAGITIDSVRTTPSTCANNGTITVYAQSSSTLFYAITGGPAIRPPQTIDLFASLSPGTYDLLVTDLLNDSIKTTAIVGGNYTSPTFSPTYIDPPCPGASAGSIIGNPLNTGTPPYTWDLTDMTTGTSTTQSSDTFKNLPPGSYSLRETDSCGNFSTYSITLLAPSDSFAIVGIINNLLPCDSVRLEVALFILNAHYAPPYTIQIQTHNGTYQQIIPSLVSGGSANPIFTLDVGGVSYGDYINFTISDACGRSVYAANTVSDYNVKINFTAQNDSCQLEYIADFYLQGDSTQSNVNSTYFPDPVTIIVYNATTGAFIDSSVTNDTVGHSSEYAYSVALIGNQNYTITVKDACGHVLTKTYAWPITPPTMTTGSIIKLSCMDSTACYEIQWQNTFFSLPTFELLSGPGYISSTKAHYVYNDTIIYPHYFVCNGGSNGYFIQLTNLAAGTYHYRVVDSCGNSITDSFTITPQELNSNFFVANYIKGCPGQNVIAISNDNFSYSELTGPGIGIMNLISPTDTLINLNAGTFIASFHYTQTTWAQSVNQNPRCQVIIDTIDLPAYVAPVVSYSTQIKCHGTMYVTFLVDSATGVAPYKYEILSGPQTTGIQSSNLFTLTKPGSYVARVTDSCGFANTFSFTVDTLSFTQVVKAGSSCIGYSVYLNCQYSPYAKYIWQEPNGTIYTGDSLYINPITPASFGNYFIKKIVSINGCTDTFTDTYDFTGDTITQTYASICPGQSVVFAGISRTLGGTYYDTIQTATCDSVVALNLTIKGPVYDSVAQSTCMGTNVIVGIHTYNIAGIYRDTLTTAAGCDSIHILNLSILPYKTGSVSTVICPGQSLTFGGIARSLAGVYYDTIATTGCDSIVTLTLSIRGPLYDSVSLTICEGTSVSSGIHTYTTTGIYRDTIATGACDSIHIFDLQVTPYSTGAVATTICPGQSFTFGGIARSITGTYHDTIPTTGCDSIVTLVLSIRGPLYDSVSQTICEGQSITVGANTYSATGIYRDTIPTAGCDSVYVLNLHVTPYGTGSVSTTICPGQSFTFGGIAHSTAGVYYDTIPTTGCDSIVTLTLSIRGPLYDSVSQTICQGQSVTIGTNTYSTTGIYRDTIPTAGCDSMHILNLLVTPYLQSATSVSICPGQIFLFGNQSLTAAGMYYDTIPTTGCDSIVTLTLSIKGPVYDSVSQSICPGQSVTVGTNTYSATGIYRDTFVTAGCDSIYILNLTVGTNGRSSIDTIICPGQSYQFSNFSLSATGTYYDTISTTGCDSIVTLTLSIRGPLYDSVSQTICEGQSVTVGINIYSTSGIYRDTIPTAGCDSVYVLDLHVTPYSTSNTSVTICPGQTYQFGSLSLSAAGTYYDTIPTTGCDSIASLTLNIRGSLYDSVIQTICEGQSVTVGTNIYSTTGVYRDTIPTAGCDSIYVLNLQVMPFLTGAVSVIICPGQAYLFGSQVLTVAGIYYDTIPTTGCDSIVTLTLGIRGPLFDSVSQTICEGQSVNVGIHTYTTAGLYYDTIPTAGCDSVHVLDLYVTPYGTSSGSVIICPGHSYQFGNRSLSSAGVYNDTIPTTGCDSIVTLTLSIRGPLYDSVSQTICEGNAVSVGSNTYISTGIYRDTIPTAGCDSIHVLNLKVTPYVHSSFSANVCPGQSITVGTHIYTTSGTYIDTVSASIGCDTVITTLLTLITPSPQTVTINATCITTYNSQTYTSNATVTDTITSSLGCDSIYLTANINISPPVDSVIDKSVCIYSWQSYIIGGQSYTTPGTYSDTLRTELGGCDSIITNTTLRVITPQYIQQHIDSCYKATVGGVTYTSDTLLRDTVSSSCGLDSIIATDSIHLFDPSIIIISSLELPIIVGQSTQLTITPSGNYQNIIWSPNYEISSIYSASPIVSPRQDTTYYVTAEDANHCPVSAQIEVTVVGTDQPDFLMPTAFSPNGDGLNDIYRPVNKSGVPLDVQEFQIYDRWGVKVYDKNITGTVGWDGTYKNREQPIGVYIYYIVVKISSDNIVKQSGNVTLVR